MRVVFVQQRWTMNVIILAVSTIFILKIDCKWINGENTYESMKIHAKNETLEENTFELIKTAFILIEMVKGKFQNTNHKIYHTPFFHFLPEYDSKSTVHLHSFEARVKGCIESSTCQKALMDGWNCMSSNTCLNGLWDTFSKVLSK